jgi:hypothetical protein
MIQQTCPQKQIKITTLTDSGIKGFKDQGLKDQGFTISD